MFDLLIFIGRFQPFHNEHKRVVDTAMSMSKHVLVLVGSAGSPRTIRNPFTYSERKSMIMDNYPHYLYDGKGNGEYYRKPEFTEPKLIIKPLFDMKYNDTAWIEQVQSLVKRTALDIANPGQANRIFRPCGTADLKIGLIGASKDSSSYYLKLFPQFENVEVPLDFRLDATDIRRDYFTGPHKGWIDERVPENVSKFLFGYIDRHEGHSSQFNGVEDPDPTWEPGFEATNYWKQLRKEWLFADDYKKAWEAAPYPVKHVTVDAVVEQSGHVLLVRRKAEPGKGLWALPGGHLEIDERVKDGIIRELREETKIKVPDPVLRGSIKSVEVFDDPSRSTIGRVITHAAHIKLVDDVKLPRVKGSDDADKAKWVPISDLKEQDFFDDHYHIIQYFLGV